MQLFGSRFNILLLNKILFTILYLEIFLGGSGRLFEISKTLTLRIVLFLIVLFISTIYYIKKLKIPIILLYIIGVHLCVLLFSCFMGILCGNEISLIFEDIKPLSSLLLLLYTFIFINTLKDIEYVDKLIRISCIVLAIFHISLFFILIFDFWGFQQIWDFISITLSEGKDVGASSEFMFKGSYGFLYYKGDIYLCIGFIFWDKHLDKIKRKILILSFIGFAIILTGTRGFILFIALVYLYELIIKKKSFRSYIFIAITIMSVLLMFVIMLPYIGDKDDSDLTRFIQIDEVVSDINILSFFLGHGFGHGVPIRPIHMEIAYLEIFHKQGVIGIIYWLYLLVFIYHFCRLTKLRSNIIKPFWLSTLFVFLISFTNPYINHPLGIGIIVLCIASSYRLNEVNKSVDRDRYE